MKKLILVIISFILINFNYCYAQKPGTNPQINKQQILSTVRGFLKWYKEKGRDTTIHYQLIKGGPPDSTTRPSIDWEGVEAYLAHLNSSGYVTPAYLNTHREYFKEIDENLKGFKLTSELIKINGMDIDFVLGTFEPEEIFDRLQKGKIHQIAVIYRKAIISYQLSPQLCLLFTLSYNKKWLIDSIGYDNTHKNSFGEL